MAKTTTQINNELTVYQCCIADKAYKYMMKEQMGIDDPCTLNNIIMGVILIEALKCPEDTIDYALDQDEYEATLEQLNHICGCVNCTSHSIITNDTLLNASSGCINCIDTEDDDSIIVEEGSE